VILRPPLTYILYLPGALDALSQLPGLMTLLLNGCAIRDTTMSLRSDYHRGISPRHGLFCSQSSRNRVLFPTVVKSLWAIASLVGRLTCARVEICFNEHEYDQIPSGLAEPAIRSVCVNSPSIQNLRLAIHGKYFGDKPCVYFTSTFLGLLKALPLRSISLNGIGLLEGVDIAELGPLFPEAEHLEFAPQKIGFKDQYSLAVQLPRLRVIGVNFDVYTCPYFTGNIPAAAACLPFMIESDWVFDRLKAHTRVREAAR
jgi:hypothetical protein